MGVGANLPSHFGAVYISQFHFSTTFSLTGIQDLRKKNTMRTFYFFSIYAMSDKIFVACSQRVRVYLTANRSVVKLFVIWSKWLFVQGKTVSGRDTRQPFLFLIQNFKYLNW